MESNLDSNFFIICEFYKSQVNEELYECHSKWYTIVSNRDCPYDNFMHLTYDDLTHFKR